VNSFRLTLFVTPGLDPGVQQTIETKTFLAQLDARVKPGHDDEGRQIMVGNGPD
jgi:hypothetical protein